jgi:hypothetical protein
MQQLSDARYRAGDVLGRCSPIADAYSHGPAASPSGATKKCFTSSVDLCDHLVRSTIVVLFRSPRILIQESDQPLIDPWFPDQLCTGETGNFRDQRPRLLAAALDHV